ncbi:hypothetical protein [Actinomadura roseirufa]|uniref:hypothetical protein n=1 Tax=Actinomadura roseirufa TaxID=2094049 RepID=UPI00104184F7|nr:hypothetical protein [Actinomadura roseirufa]
MSDATGTFHLSHPRLGGPAERTVVQPWLTELSNATLNAYTEISPALAVVEALPVPAPSVPAPAVRAEPRRGLAVAA